MSKIKIRHCYKCNIILNDENATFGSRACKICKNKGAVERYWKNKAKREPIEPIVVKNVEQERNLAQQRNRRNENIKMLANEIVKQYRMKTKVGLVCAIKDLVKYYDKQKIKIGEVN